MAQMDRLSGAVNALTKYREDELVELHEQRELRKRIPSSTRDRIGGLIDVAYYRICRRTIRTLRTEMRDA